MNPRNGSLRTKTSFFYPFLLLPKEKRRALEALYRFCWAADDISDNSHPLPVKKKKLQKFKKELDQFFAGKPQGDLFKNLAVASRQFTLSKGPLLRILAGVERDLRPIRFRAFEELRHYCLQVAGGPGLASMEIFGFRDQAHRDYAENLGIFLQIVNMTRDYREDMALRRQYFPAEDFKKFNLTPGSLDDKNPAWVPFVDFQLSRAWSFLEASRRSLTSRQRGELPTAEAIAAVYVRLFEKLKEHPRRILAGKTSLSRRDKLFSAAGAAIRCLWRRWTGL